MVTGVIHYVKQGGDGSMVGWMQPPMAATNGLRREGGQSGLQRGAT
jgi:hypothetical protein